MASRDVPMVMEEVEQHLVRDPKLGRWFVDIAHCVT
jgi:hypothetical protein